MLIEFKVANYRSFNEEQTLSMIASSDTSIKQNCIEVGRMALLRSVAMYGPNASGKSNIIKAIYTMQTLVEKSATSKPGDPIPVSPFRLGDKNNDSPSTFEVMFHHKGVRYQYGFSVSSKRVHSEWLISYPKEYAQKWFVRELNSKTNEYNWNFSTLLKGEKENLKDKTKDNSLFLSVAAQWNHDQLSTVYDWFKGKLAVFPIESRPSALTSGILDYFGNDTKEGKALLSIMIKFLKDADLGINGVRVKKDDFKASPQFNKFPPELKEALIKSAKDRSYFRVEMLHKNHITGEDVAFQIEDESDGTKRFFELVGPWLDAIIMGKTIVYDELDKSLHPLLTRGLIKFIQNPFPNSPGAQLIFVTHDTSLLDPELFRRDQIWFVEKNNNGESRLYSLADYKEKRVRKGEALEKGYLSGRYGATPILENFGLYEHETAPK
jgi:uncharacterized protein